MQTVNANLWPWSTSENKDDDDEDLSDNDWKESDDQTMPMVMNIMN